MQEDDGKESTIVFSKIVGEKCTYQVGHEDIKSYGENSDEYNSTFGNIF